MEVYKHVCDLNSWARGSADRIGKVISYIVNRQTDIQIAERGVNHNTSSLRAYLAWSDVVFSQRGEWVREI